jgi:hypothetical protein
VPDRPGRNPGQRVEKRLQQSGLEAGIKEGAGIPRCVEKRIHVEKRIL